MSCDVLAISRLFSSCIYKVARFLSFIQRVIQRFRESVVQRKIAECSKKTLFCGDCCDRNLSIILMVLV